MAKPKKKKPPVRAQIPLHGVTPEQHEKVVDAMTQVEKKAPPPNIEDVSGGHFGNPPKKPNK